MSSRLLRLLAALLASVLVLGACGGDDDEDDDTTGSTTSTTVEAPGDGDDEADTTDDTVEETVDPDEGDDTGTDEDAASFDPAVLESVDDFCQLDAVGDEAFMALTSDTPEGAEQGAQFMAAFFTRATEIAPDELSEDLRVLTGALGELYAAAADHDYDIEAMYAAAAEDPELQARLDAADAPEVEAADQRVTDWVDANCAE